MKYNCETCKYSTDVHCNFQKHVNSKKHLEKVSELIDVKNVASNLHKCDTEFAVENENKCPYCNNLYMNRTCLSRHKKMCIEKRNLIESHIQKEKEMNNSIKILTEQLSKKDIEVAKEIAYKDEIIKNKDDINRKNDDIMKSKDETILYLAHENKNLKTMLNCAGTMVEKSVSNLSYLNKHYPNAPALEYIKDIPDLHEDLSEDNVVDNIIYEYKNHTLISFIGNLIIKDYKKTDPNQQSLWNSDADRLTYMIRSLLANETTQWEVDKKGINTTKYIIKPITDYIKKQLENYIKTCEVSRSQKTKKIMGSVYKMADCRIVIGSIDDGELAGGILKYISPYLYMVKETQELV